VRVACTRSCISGSRSRRNSCRRTPERRVAGVNGHSNSGTGNYGKQQETTGLLRGRGDIAAMTGIAFFDW
jgi:hypothetical protein